MCGQSKRQLLPPTLLLCGAFACYAPATKTTRGVDVTRGPMYYVSGAPHSAKVWKDGRLVDACRTNICVAGAVAKATAEVPEAESLATRGERISLVSIPATFVGIVGVVVGLSLYTRERTVFEPPAMRRTERPDERLGAAVSIGSGALLLAGIAGQIVGDLSIRRAIAIYNRNEPTYSTEPIVGPALLREGSTTAPGFVVRVAF